MHTETSLPEPEHHKTSMSTEGEAAIGRIALWCAWLEQNLLDLCASLINEGHPEIGRLITASMSASNRVDLAKQLVSQSTVISAETKAATQTALIAAKAALVARNRVLHAPVGSSLLEGKNVFYNGKRKTFVDEHGRISLQAEHLSTEELDAIGAGIYKAMDDLFECHLSIAHP